MGLSVSDAIRMMLRRVAGEKRLPFDVKVPNAESMKAKLELEADKGKRFVSTDALFDDLGTCPLRGDWASYDDLHIEPDWLLLYAISASELKLVRMAMHSDLFEE